MLTRMEKAYIRDLLRVPMAGVPRGGHTSGYRYFSLVGNLEFYMNNLSVEEETVIAGRPMALINFQNPPVLNQQLTILVNATPITYTVQQTDLNDTFPQQSVLLNFVNLINAAALGPWAGSGDSPSQSAGAAPLTAPPYGQIAISWYNPFEVSVSQPTTNGLILSVEQNGNVYPEPSMDVMRNGVPSKVYGYINVCLELRNDLLNSRRNLSLDSAGAKGDQGGVTFRKEQLFQQSALLYEFVDRLASALYTKVQPMRRPSGSVTV